jgi:cellulose synthase/poly-beta-1,6-N-acetylglucosamine synthase-like glycosyltransferase
MVRVLWELHHRLSLVSPKMGELVAFRANLVDSVSEISVVDEASIENIVQAKGYHLGYVGEAIVTNHGPERVREYFEQRRRIARGHYWLDFAFGYRVASLDKATILRTVASLYKDSDGKDKAALAAAVGIEVLARAVGFWDARVIGGKHRTWKPLESTKKLKDDDASREAS